MQIEAVVLSTIQLVFALIFFFIYLYYPRGKEYLIFAILCVLTVPTITLNFAEDTVVRVAILRLVSMTTICLALYFLYTLFYRKVLKFLYYYILSCSIMVVWIFFNPRISDTPYIYIFLSIGSVEIIRIVIRAIVKKIEFAWIIGLGILMIVIFGIYEIFMDIIQFSPILGEEDPGVYASVFLMVTMAVYLAQRFAKTNTDLAQKSDELRQLNIELEERVAKRTEELAKANRALEKHNVDLTASRDKIRKAHQELQKTHEELRQTQRRLVQSEKMASLGNLAAGVAHEINTPIGAVNSAADTSKRAIARVIQSIEESQSLEDLNTDQKFRDSLNFIKGNNDLITLASERIVKIVKSLGSFARLDEADLKDVDIHEGIDSTLTLLHHTTKERIAIIREYGYIPKISCRPSQLNQVFMNLLKNATESIKDKGTIHIKTSVEENKVIIRISDDGLGIKKENLNRVFDPGFTTKGVGVGTGLGLSISYNIIHDHSGEIEVESEEGKGSTFSILLPIKQK
jgi:signal transduction histidine kinase